MEGKTIYSYIQVLFELTQQFKFCALVLFVDFKSSLYHFLFQSRYYRSPEVLLAFLVIRILCGIYNQIHYLYSHKHLMMRKLFCFCNSMFAPYYES